MTIENVLSSINYNIRKIVEELRKRITNISEISEIIDDRQITYQTYSKDFCTIKIKKDHLEIDFITGKTLEDPIEFSWKIKPIKDRKFDRRMQIKNMRDIDTAFVLIFQSYNVGRCPPPSGSGHPMNPRNIDN